MFRYFFLFFLFSGSTFSLTCYNGMKMLAMQSVGETTEECPSSSYCYNMSTSAMVMINVVKAGCSTWRCMLAKDTCIFTTFQAIPVSLCCCSYDRCNVGGNPVYSDNVQQLTNNGQNSNSGGGSWGDSNQNNNNNGWGNNYDYNQQYKYDGQNAQKVNEDQMTKQTVGGAYSSNKAKNGEMTKKQLEDAFKKSIDDRGDEIQLEDDFKKVDKNYEIKKVPKKTEKSTKNIGKEINI